MEYPALNSRIDCSILPERMRFSIGILKKGVEKDNFTPLIVPFVKLYKTYVIPHVETVVLMSRVEK